MTSGKLWRISSHRSEGVNRNHREPVYALRLTPYARRQRRRLSSAARASANTASTVMCCMQRLLRQSERRLLKALTQGLQARPAHSTWLRGERAAPTLESMERARTYRTRLALRVAVALAAALVAGTDIVAVDAYARGYILYLAMQGRSDFVQAPLKPLRDDGLIEAHEREIERARDLGAGVLFTGLELVELPGVVALNTDQICRDWQAVLEAGVEGVVLSWDLWHMPLERLKLVSDILVKYS